MLQYIRYSIDTIRDEARELICNGILNSNQPIYVLSRYFPASEWDAIECELERHDLLLRDQILDLVGCENWCED